MLFPWVAGLLNTAVIAVKVASFVDTQSTPRRVPSSEEKVGKEEIECHFLFLVIQQRFMYQRMPSRRFLGN